MIDLNDKLIDEISELAPEEIIKKFSPEEVESLTIKIIQQTAKLESDLKEREEKEHYMRQQLIKEFGAKPIISLFLTGEDEVEINLIISGVINTFPERIGIFDGFELLSFIANLLHIPEKRQRVDNALARYQGPINQTPLATVDYQVYGRKVAHWLNFGVNPKPKIHWFKKINIFGKEV
ncbi:MAG TPA: hypothetical protein DDW50_04385 [Firmicutes bacterium]|jgi:hypothetical protein|nr:hypothetical protein [Bacillota bacterium]